MSIPSLDEFSRAYRPEALVSGWIRRGVGDAGETRYIVIDDIYYRQVYSKRGNNGYRYIDTYDMDDVLIDERSGKFGSGWMTDALKETVEKIRDMANDYIYEELL